MTSEQYTILLSAQFQFISAGPPVCTHSISQSNLTHNVLNASCIVSFRGNLFPVMEWRESNSKYLIINGVLTERNKNYSVTSTLTMSMIFGYFPIITCTTRFVKTIVPSGRAANVPAYTSVWMFPWSNSTNG